MPIIHCPPSQIEIQIDKSQTSPYLFVFYDAGETRALTPVLEVFEQNGIDFRVLVMGTAREEAGPKKFSAKRIDLQDIGVEEQVDKSWPRTKALSEASLQKIASKVIASNVVVGTASKIQEQIILSYPRSRTFAYWDNFNYDPNNPAFETAYKVQAAASKVICPSQYIKNELMHGHPEKYMIGGQPTLDVWKEETAYAEQHRDELLKEMGLQSGGGKVVVFIGGYGEKFEKASQLFLQCQTWLKDHGYQVNVQMHPKVGNNRVPTSQAVGVSDYVVCYDSTVGYQALFFNKNVIFAIPEGDPATNFAIKMGFADKASNVKEFADQVTAAQQRPVRDFYKLIGVPKNSTDTIVEMLCCQLSKGRRPL